MATEGRRRQTIEELRIELQKIFEGHPGSHLNDAGETVMPADALVDVFSSLSDSLSDEPLMSGEEVAMFEALLKNNPGLEVTPQIILNFIEEKAKIHLPRSPGNSDDDAAAHEGYQGHSRSSSNESNGSAFYPNSGSRPPSRGSQTPAPMKSPLDSQRRQRSTPLAAPSSWSTKRPAPSRRKSDAGSRSDSDSHGGAFVRSSSRTGMRGPSNPTSPSSSYRDLGVFSPASPPLGATISRPHSRAHSQPQNSFSSSHFDHGYSSPDDNYTVRRPRSQYGYNYNDSFESSVTMPRASNSDSDDEDEIDADLVLDRHNASSTISLELHDRLDALQRNNEELSRKLLEAEKTLQDKLTNYDVELDEAQHKLEELRSELNASNREEKDLRTKDTKNMTTIATYEIELNTVTKSLEQSRATYLSLQKQYQEQCTVSEKYRDDLRLREETIRSLKDVASVHEAEAVKWLREREMYEDRIALLERELEVLSVAQTHLDEQKQQNLFLKETIDRVRYEMDEMRNAAPADIAGSGQSSAANTISKKSLGAELMGKMKFDMDADEELEEGDISLEDDDKTEVADEEEEEDVVQTIITKRKRKVASRASVIETRRAFDELKEYSDGATQYDPTLFAVNHGMQTDPPPKIMKASSSIQTETPPEPKKLPIPPPRITIEMEIQTEEVDEPSRSPSPQLNDESMASSSSTIVPPTPKPQTKILDHEHADEPPAYNQITEGDRDEREWRVAAETLKKWHNGVKIPFEPVAGGVSEEAVEDWKALKEELGVGCMIIDKIMANSDRAIAASTSRLPKEQKARRGGRFYNIYNTYVYGDSNGSSSPTSGGFSFGFASQAVVLMGASALVLMAATPYLAPNYSIPGGATYYDRSAWNSFNSMQAAGEGFGPDGTAAVWNFLGRVGGGAVRMARGWPT